MTKTELSLAFAGIVACSALTYGIVAVGFPKNGQAQQSSAPVKAPVPPRPPWHDEVRESTVQMARVEPVPVAAPIVLPPLGDTAIVSDQTLLRLSGMVNLANAMNEPPNKAGWQQALPIAEKLLVSPCDCAQKNWLNHFVETGDHALHGSGEEYKQSAQVLVALGRNNEQVVAISKGLY